MSEPAARPWTRAWIRPVGGLLGLALVMGLVHDRAWLCDDAFISLRVAEHLRSGWGFTWNVGERALAVTNPLWTLLLAPTVELVGNGFLAVIFLSLACSFLAVAQLLLRLPRSPANLLAVALALVGCRAFLDYSTSGLENPLSHALLVTFLGTWFLAPPSPRRLGLLALVAALGLTTRHDTLLLYGPAMAAALWELRGPETRARAVGAVLLGGLPFLAWTAFSLFYFGSALPNTALAKLNTGIPAAEAAAQGLRYLYVSFLTDPVLAAVILGAPLLGLLRGQRGARALGLGVLLHLAYTVKVGGDYMAGRFLTNAFVAGTCLLALAPLPRAAPRAALLPGLVLAVALIVPTWEALGQGPWPEPRARDGRARMLMKVADSRYFLSERWGLDVADPNELVPPEAPEDLGERLARGERRVAVVTGAGWSVYKRGSDVHAVDLYALGDPLLARLPMYRGHGQWRAGHYRRVLPQGYVRSLETGENHLEDPGLAALYEQLRLVHQAPLLAPGRLRAIWVLNVHGDDAWIDENAYVEPPRREVAAAVLSDAELADFDIGGLGVDFEEPVRAEALALTVDPRMVFEVGFFLDGDRVGKARLRPPEVRKGLPREPVARILELPGRVQRRGFDRLELDGLWNSDQRFELGAVVVMSSGDGAADAPHASLDVAQGP